MRHFRRWLHWHLDRRQARAWIHANGLPVVARAMWLLNRHARVVANDRLDIYGLKNRFVGELYKRVPCEVSEQVQRLDCWCGGDEWCPKCGGTGVYREFTLYLFRFEIAGRHYAWHQPERYVDWPVEVVGEAGEFTAPRAQGPALRLARPERDVLMATVYEWLRSAGVPAGELPRVPTLGWAWCLTRNDWYWWLCAWRQHLLELRWRMRQRLRREREAHLAVELEPEEEEIPF